MVRINCFMLFFFTEDFVQRSFVGYSSANYILSEVRDPIRTIKLAAPLAVITLGTLYFCINISYFAVVSKKDILESRRIIALVIAQILPSNSFCSIVFFFLAEPYTFGIYLVLQQKRWVFITYVCWSWVADTAHATIRFLALSSRYLRWATYWPRCFLMVEVTNLCL